MTEVDSHDDVHVVLKKLGDISVEAPAMETRAQAWAKYTVRYTKLTPSRSRIFGRISPAYPSEAVGLLTFVLYLSAAVP